MARRKFLEANSIGYPGAIRVSPSFILGVSPSFKLFRPLFDRLSTCAERLRVRLEKLSKGTPRVIASIRSYRLVDSASCLGCSILLEKPEGTHERTNIGRVI
jgi:hypothetical protein